MVWNEEGSFIRENLGLKFELIFHESTAPILWRMEGELLAYSVYFKLKGFVGDSLPPERLHAAPEALSMSEADVLLPTK